MLVRLGREGYRHVQQSCRDVAMGLAQDIAAMDELALVSHGDQLPVLAFRDGYDEPGWSVYDVSERLRAHGWIVPAYPMPTGMEHVHVLRVVVRNGFTSDLADLFVRDLRTVLKRLTAGDAGSAAPGDRTGFHH